MFRQHITQFLKNWLLRMQRMKAAYKKAASDLGDAQFSPFRKRAVLHSEVETQCFHALQQAAEGWAVVLCKVHLSDLVASDPMYNNLQLYQQVAHYPVDFVLCKPQTLMPLVVVKLDINRWKAQRPSASDKLVARMLNAADLPLITVHASEYYNIQQLAQTLRTLALPTAVS